MGNLAAGLNKQDLAFIKGLLEAGKINLLSIHVTLCAKFRKLSAFLKKGTPGESRSHCCT